MRIIDQVILDKNKTAASLKVIEKMNEIFKRNPEYKNQLLEKGLLGKQKNTPAIVDRYISKFKELNADTAPDNRSFRLLGKEDLNKQFNVTEPRVNKDIREGVQDYKKALHGGNEVSVYDLGQHRPKNKVGPSTPHISDDLFENEDILNKAFINKRINNFEHSDTLEYGKIEANKSYEKIVKSDYLKDKEVGKFFNSNLLDKEFDIKNNIKPEVNYSVKKNLMKGSEFQNPYSDLGYKDNVNTLGLREKFVNEVTSNKKFLIRDKAEAALNPNEFQKLPELKHDFNEIYKSGEIPKDVPISDRVVYKGDSLINRTKENIDKDNVSQWVSPIPFVGMKYAGENRFFRHEAEAPFSQNRPIFYKAKDPQKFAEIMNPLLKENIK